MKKLKSLIICLILAGAGMLVCTGCHTAHGFGKDMQDAGQSIQNNTQ